MEFSSQIKNMTLKEKFQAMELIWDELCQNAAELESPDWHNDILQKREQRYIDKEAKLHEWDSAKENIRRSL